MTLPKTLLIVAALVMASCGTQHKIARKVKKIQRLEREINALGGVVAADTVFVTQRIIVPPVVTDSLVYVKEWADTIYIAKDRVKTKILVRPIEKTVYVSSKCDTVTIVKNVPVVVNREIKTGDTFWQRFGRSALWLILGLVLGFGGHWVLRILRVIP